ncbi:23S rRNA (adenine(2503)-C(2))-methyltransferase RlmN [Candidatus Poribacteria bacterium]|nr:23S rRNA (adenine(2503)-C(2))-methyltransferase RlmN [Candidatus Poribacteria bacterium]
MEDKIDLKGKLLPELEEIMVKWGEKSYRARQLMLWLYHKRVTDFEEITSFSKAFRKVLNEKAYVSHLKILDKIKSSLDDTTKYLFELDDGNKVESVLMYDRDRVTCCVSTQVGCAQGCAFCATGKSGFVRNLTASEIINQIMTIEAELGGGIRADGAVTPKVVTNVVLMGMGEPFANYEQVEKAVSLMNGAEGLMIAARKITISTSGLVPMIRKFTAKGTQIGLALSLNATDDKLRSRLMPVNRKYPIKDVLLACKEWALAVNRQLTVEYILIKNVNDSLTHAKELCKILHGIPSKVNLIAYNPVEGISFERPEPEKVEIFRQRLADSHFVAPVRISRGIDIAAACGQLRVKNQG